MNVGIIPIIMSVAVCIVCGVAALLGGLLLIDVNSRPAGWQVLRCSGMALVTGVFFAWEGMYILAAWTGYRKGEIGSLTKRSLKLDDTPPTVTVAAAYSKRKRTDTQVLHPEVAARLREWLATKEKVPPDAPLFPVSDKVKGGRIAGRRR